MDIHHQNKLKCFSLLFLWYEFIWKSNCLCKVFVKSLFWRKLIFLVIRFHLKMSDIFFDLNCSHWLLSLRWCSPGSSLSVSSTSLNHVSTLLQSTLIILRWSWLTPALQFSRCVLEWGLAPGPRSSAMNMILTLSSRQHDLIRSRLWCFVTAREASSGHLGLVRRLLMTGSCSPRKLMVTGKSLPRECSIMLASLILTSTTTPGDHQSWLQDT